MPKQQRQPRGARLRAGEIENAQHRVIEPSGAAVCRGRDRKQRHQQHQSHAFRHGGGDRQDRAPDAVAAGEGGKVAHQPDRLGCELLGSGGGLNHSR
jgi:hypothetical protein